MSVTDDLPWPELGNVSRGATRGNQGQKGVLGPPDRDGRCTLQLRVQPGVLAVRLNRQASDWYRTLDNEVNRALKLTKTYWRKARRRQDYDARADQDHMELHEWLQQLKDKTMSHLELLMQKGDIQGPPYTMPDDIELTFLRKFIERQAAGMPHNPRLRNGADPGYIIRAHSVDSGSPDPSDQNYQDQRNRDPTEAVNNHMSMSSRPSDSPTLRNPDSLAQEATTSKQALQISRAALARAQKDTQDAFLRYTACLDAERQARQSVAAAEKRRDDILKKLFYIEQRSRQSSVSLEEAQAAHALTRYHNEVSADVPIVIDRCQAQDFKNRSNTKPLEWGDAETQGIYATEPMAHLENHGRIVRKHSRTWENGGQLQGISPPLNSDFQDLSGLPPRKRIHHMIPGYDVMSNPLQAQNMTLQP
ncbi:hypothetical protein EV359DRAFT_29852 [Lentinula novae-zelandiae]|nr:hypothetical protein EV359DRAFT_29852 [Lentinula novae-zelandiae]